MTTRTITDDALVAFVLWCRANDAALVTDPVVARRVFDAYRLLKPLSQPEAATS